MPAVGDVDAIATVVGHVRPAETELVDEAEHHQLRHLGTGMRLGFLRRLGRWLGRRFLRRFSLSLRENARIRLLEKEYAEKKSNARCRGRDKP